MEIEFITRTHLDAQVAVSARRQVVHGRIIFTIESENPRWTDPHTRATPMTQAAVDNLGETAQGPRGFIFSVLVPLERIDKTTLLTEWRVGERLGKYSQRS
jgi:hypothetical protein